MKTEQGSIAYIILVSVIVVLLISGTFFIIKSQNANQLNSTSELSYDPPEVKNLNEGEHTVTLYPGKTVFELPSGASINFNNDQIDLKAPEFVFGEKNAPPPIRNALQVRSVLSTYHGDYKYDLKLGDCEYKSEFDWDMWIQKTVKCEMNITIKKEKALKKVPEKFSKQFDLMIMQNGRVTNNDEPLLFFITRDSIRRVQKDMNGKVIEPATDWFFELITNYGVQPIKYTKEELWEKTTKKYMVQSQEITLTIDELSCRDLRMEGEDCPYYTGGKFTIHTQSSESSSSTLQILDYQ